MLYGRFAFFSPPCVVGRERALGIVSVSAGVLSVAVAAVIACEASLASMDDPEFVDLDEESLSLLLALPSPLSEGDGEREDAGEGFESSSFHVFLKVLSERSENERDRKWLRVTGV